MLESLAQQAESWMRALESKPLWIAVCVVIVFVLVGYAYLKAQHKPVKVSKNGIGRVHVSKSALRGLIYAVCQAEGVRKPRARITMLRGKLQVSVTVNSDNTTSIHNLATRLQTRLAQTLYENIGEDEVGQIDVIISGFKKSKQVPEEKENSEGFDSREL